MSDEPDLFLLQVKLVTILLTALTVVLSLIFCNVAVGRRQQREGRGTWRRLILVSTAVAAMQLAPATVAGLLWLSDFDRLNRDALLVAAAIMVPANIVFLFATLKPTVRFVQSEKSLPLVTDPILLARVNELASRMNLSPPVVRLLTSAGGELQVQAFAGGLVAPSLVVGDGVLHRLSPDERDAVVGHELAHIANGSLWWLNAPFPISTTAGLLAASATRPTFGFAVAFTCWVGLYRLISRYFEYDCDRRAARVMGFGHAFSALEKIHAASPLRNTGWFSHIVFATATHPSRGQRLAALRDVAPPDERQNMVVPDADVRRRRIAGFFAIAVWLLALIMLPARAWQAPDSIFPAVFLIAIGTIPLLAIQLESRRATRDARRRMVARGRMRRWHFPLVLGLMIVWLGFGDRVGMSFEELIDSDDLKVRGLTMLTLLGFLSYLVFVVVTSGTRASNSLLQKAAVAMQSRDFEKVLELAKESPQPFETVAALRHNLGFAAAIGGQREQAIEVLEALREDEPGFTEAVLVLAMVHLDEGRPDDALPLIDEVQQKVPRDPTPLMLRSMVLRSLGRLEEAEECINQTLSIKPDSGNGHAVAATIALDRGDHERAAKLLRAAESHDPATAYIEYVKALIAMAGDDPTAAREQVARAVAASNANPFALLQNQVAQLSSQTESDDAHNPLCGPTDSPIEPQQN